ncbi:MAG: hypothetical protein GYB33_14295 [Gammaproteobacteria bacterium]|nr:hypothetical protein [Gammaproteobacteria bacterium]
MAAMRFFTWAATPDYTPPVDWLPEKPEGIYWEGGKTPGPEQSHYFRALKKKFMEHKWKRQAATDEQLEAISEYEARCRQQQGTFEDYQEYEQLGTVAMQ